MKYSLLAQWATEQRDYTNVISKLLISPQEAILTFKNEDALVIKYLPADALLYFTGVTRDYQKSSMAEIWTNLHNAELKGVTMAPRDRIFYFHIWQKDIYQQITQYQLVFECTPPKPNLILCKVTQPTGSGEQTQSGERLIISDAIIKYSYADNPKRQVLPSLVYETPSTSFNPVPEETILPLMISPAQDGEPILCNTVNDYFRLYYLHVSKQKLQVVTSQSMTLHWQKELKKVDKKLAAQRAELLDAEKEKTWLTYSELLKINLHNVKKGDTEFVTTDYFTEGMPQITIPLASDKTPKANLQQYFKKYRKAKNGKLIIAQNIAKTATEKDNVLQIIAALQDGSYEHSEVGKTHSHEAIAKLKQADSLFRLPINPSWEIVIGRKAKENDFLSTQLGRPHDWWFHTRIYHGSHILLRNYAKQQPSALLIELCCGLAAWFSKAKNSQNVPVDYTQIRFVRKPRKSAPGYVTYSNHKTVFVDPIDVPAAKEILKRYEE